MINTYSAWALISAIIQDSFKACFVVPIFLNVCDQARSYHFYVGTAHIFLGTYRAWI